MYLEEKIINFLLGNPRPVTIHEISSAIEEEELDVLKVINNSKKIKICLVTPLGKLTGGVFYQLK